LPLPAGAQRAAEPAPQREGETLRVANRPIIVLRGPIAGYSGAERARAAAERIEVALHADPAPALSTKERQDIQATQVMMGDKLAFTVTPVDIDTAAGETTQAVAAEALRRLQQAIPEHLEQRQPRYLAAAAGKALAATLVFALLLWLVLRANRWVGGRLAAAAAARSHNLNVAGVRLLEPSRVLLVTRRAIAVVAATVALVLSSAWLGFVLVSFPYTRPWGEQLEGNLLGMLKGGALATAQAMPGLLLVAVILFIAHSAVRIADVFLMRVERGRSVFSWLDADTLLPTRRILQVLIWVFAIAMAFPYLPGADTEAFKGLSVLVGIMVSLGGASVIGQAFNGLILMYTRALRRGEYVRIGDHEGTVIDLGLFTTRIRTGMGEEITLPNSGVMAGAIRNYSRAVEGTGYVVDTVVTIGYATPWRQVEAMLLEAARRTADIVREPAPVVRQTALSDYYVEYRLVAYTPVESPALRADVLNRLHGQIQDVFNEHGVQIMSPHYMADPASPQVVPKKDWYAAPAKPPEQTKGETP
jgi:small-conductance mechanosensitive channel